MPAAPEGPAQAPQAAPVHIREEADPAPIGTAAVQQAPGPQPKKVAPREAPSAPRATSDASVTLAGAAEDTGARPKAPASQRSQQRTAALANPAQMSRTIVLLPEPYANWRERLVGLFRALTPERVDGRFVVGHVGQVYVQRPLSESYLVTAKYDVNVRGGENIRWMRVVEGVVRGMRMDFQRHPITFEPLPAMKTEKAACGVRVQVGLKPLSLAHSGP